MLVCHILHIFLSKLFLNKRRRKRKKRRQRDPWWDKACREKRFEVQNITIKWRSRRGNKDSKSKYLEELLIQDESSSLIKILVKNNTFLFINPEFRTILLLPGP